MSISRPGDPENLNDLGPVFAAECWLRFEEGCGWSHGPGEWTPVYRELCAHEAETDHVGSMKRLETA